MHNSRLFSQGTKNIEELARIASRESEEVKQMMAEMAFDMPDTTMIDDAMAGTFICIINLKVFTIKTVCCGKQR